jgi:hypothetical protein
MGMVHDVTGDAPADVRVDAGALFGECTSNNQCPGSGAICITNVQGYPGGLCTHRCATDAQCGDGACIPYGSEQRCFPRCEIGSDCRAGYNCFTFTDLPDTPVCLPLCTADAQCGAIGCDEYTGFCGSPDVTLAGDGAGCGSDSDCRSDRCFEEVDAMGEPSGNLGGLCYSLCTIPDDTEYATSLPHGSCPDSAVCVRGDGDVAGDVGLCRPECTTETDCRPGFICLHPSRVGSSQDTTNGYCVPMNCHYMTQMCPPTATCVTDEVNDAGMPTSGTCVANGDGGVTDAGSDAATDVGADTAPDAGSVGDAADDAGADASSDVVDDLADDVVDSGSADDVDDAAEAGE